MPVPCVPPPDHLPLASPRMGWLRSLAPDDDVLLNCFGMLLRKGLGVQGEVRSLLRDLGGGRRPGRALRTGVGRAEDERPNPRSVADRELLAIPPKDCP